MNYPTRIRAAVQPVEKGKQMGLRKPYETYEKPGIVVGYPLTENHDKRTTIFKGALVGWCVYDKTVLPLDAETKSDDLRFIGVANETVLASQTAVKRITVTKSGTFVFDYSGQRPNISDHVYAISDDTVVCCEHTPGGIHVGTVVGYEKTSTGQDGVRIRIDNYVR